MREKWKVTLLKLLSGAKPNELQLQTHTHARAHTHIHTHARTLTHIYTHIHPRTNTLTHKHKHTHIYTYTQINVHTHAHDIHLYTNTHTRTRARAHTRKYTYTHTYTYPHSHAQRIVDCQSLNVTEENGNINSPLTAVWIVFCAINHSCDMYAYCGVMLLRSKGLPERQNARLWAPTDRLTGRQTDRWSGGLHSCPRLSLC